MSIGPITSVPLKIEFVNLINPAYPKNQGPNAVAMLSGFMKIFLPDSDNQVAVNIEDMQKQVIGLEAAKKGIKPEVAAQESADNIIKNILKEEPKIVGISMKWGSLDLARKIITDVRRGSINPPLFVLGGYLPTYAYDKLFNEEVFSNVIMVKGEGEDAFLEIAKRALANPGKENDISLYKGIVNTKTKGDYGSAKSSLSMGHYVTVMREYTSAIQSPSTQTEKSQKIVEHIRAFVKENFAEMEVLSIESSRGCYWNNCKFCSVKGLYPISGRRDFPVDWIETVIELYAQERQKQGQIPRIAFIDSEFIGFSAKPSFFDHAMSRAKMLIEGIKKINEKFIDSGKEPIIIGHVSLRVTDIFCETDNPQMRNERIKFLELLKEANVQKVYVGIESGSETQLRRFKKGFTLKESAKALDVLRQVGLKYEPGFIFWDEMATMEELRENMAFIRNTGLDLTDSRLLGSHRAQIGSDMIDELQKEGLLIERSEVIDEFSRQIGGIVNAMGDRSDYEKRISAFHGWLKIKKEKHELSIKDDVESNILTLLQQGYLTIWACGSGGTNARMNATEEAQFKAQLAIDMNGSIETARRDSKLDAYVLDLDTLTYKTKYQDPKVGKLHAEFLEWEEQSRALTYSLANLVNTAPDEDFRASIAKIVMNLRRNDLRYAEELVTKNDPKNKLDLCKDLENVLMTIHWMTDNGKINGQIKANYLPRAEELNQKFLAKLNEQIFREIT